MTRSRLYSALTSAILSMFFLVPSVLAAPAVPTDAIEVVDPIEATRSSVSIMLKMASDVGPGEFHIIPEPPVVTGSYRSIEGQRIQLTGKALYVSYINQICATYFPALDPCFVQAVMQCESNYKPNISSSAGAVGLMQVIPKYHSWRMSKYGLSDIWDPYTNIMVGADFLNESYQKYGSYYRALLAYNNSDRYANHVLAVADQIRYGGG